MRVSRVQRLWYKVRALRTGAAELEELRRQLVHNDDKEPQVVVPAVQWPQLHTRSRRTFHTGPVSGTRVSTFVPARPPNPALCFLLPTHPRLFEISRPLIV